MKGRKPKPNSLKRAEGNPGNRKLNDQEPVPPAGPLDPPDWLGGEARRFFSESLVPMMVTMGVATTADISAIARYCDHLVQWAEASKFLNANGATYPLRAKDPPHEVLGFKAFPQVAIYRNLSRLLLVFEAEFGLTASSRGRLVVRDPDARRVANHAQEDAEFFGGPRLVKAG